MIVNNNNSIITTQKNIEISAANATAINLLEQMSETVAADRSLSPNTQHTVQRAIALTARKLEDEKPSREYLSKSLDALNGVGSVAGLLLKLFDLF
ncbi:MAG: hypothetical protein NTZ64_01645 [Polaromonas sp.]|nr:hypothetical protein [Polaromonas sp.]